MLTLIIGGLYVVSFGASLTVSMGRLFDRLALSETAELHGRFA